MRLCRPIFAPSGDSFAIVLRIRRSTCAKRSCNYHYYSPRTNHRNFIAESGEGVVSAAGEA